MNRRHIFLHIGTYKTGTTSLQTLLWDHRSALARHSIALYQGMHRNENHMELHMASMRYERESFARLKMSQLRFDEAYTAEVARAVRKFRRNRPEDRLLFTAEGLSLLRYPDEITRLREILDADNADVTVLVCLRNKADFLRSYSSQLSKVSGRQPSNDPESALYIKPDTFLIDYDSLLAAYRAGFGENNVTVIDYDQQMAARGNVIPAFLEILGLEQAIDGSAYFANRTQTSTGRKLRKRIKKFFLRLLPGGSAKSRERSAA